MMLSKIIMFNSPDKKQEKGSETAVQEWGDHHKSITVESQPLPSLQNVFLSLANLLLY